MRFYSLFFLPLVSLSTVNAIFTTGTSKPAEPISHLFIDFDGTIAISEAFETLGSAAYESADLPSLGIEPWSHFSNLYYTEYDAFVASYNGDRSTLEGEVSFRSDPKRRQVEEDSFNRVYDAGVFNHINLPTIRKFASQVQIRPGLWDLIDAAARSNIKVRIVSLNWSVAWIREVLRENYKKELLMKRIGRKVANLPEIVEIYCSEIIPAGIVPKNKFKNDRPVRLHTGKDKVDLMKGIISKTKKGHGVVVYIGDSMDDLPPFVDVNTTDVGIIAGSDGKLIGRLARFGVAVRNLVEGYFGATKPLKAGDEVKKLYRVDTFKEVVNVFFGKKK